MEINWKKKTKMLEMSMCSEIIFRINDSYKESYKYKISWIDNG